MSLGLAQVSVDFENNFTFYAPQGHLLRGTSRILNAAFVAFYFFEDFFYNSADNKQYIAIKAGNGIIYLGRSPSS